MIFTSIGVINLCKKDDNKSYSFMKVKSFIRDWYHHPHHHHDHNHDNHDQNQEDCHHGIINQNHPPPAAESVPRVLHLGDEGRSASGSKQSAKGISIREGLGF